MAYIRWSQGNWYVWMSDKGLNIWPSGADLNTPKIRHGNKADLEAAFAIHRAVEDFLSAEGYLRKIHKKTGKAEWIKTR